jgi:hypothetical protein
MVNGVEIKGQEPARGWLRGRPRLANRLHKGLAPWKAEVGQSATQCVAELEPRSTLHTLRR